MKEECRLTANNNASCVLRLIDIRKTFGSVRALKGVSLEVYAGEVLAIVGDNGSGKSTLIKIISGAISPDSGTIEVGGEIYKKMTPALALKKGIVTVYQDLALVNCRSVASNVFLGREPLIGRFIIDKRKMERESFALLNGLGIDIPFVGAAVGSLSGGQRQAVAVARAVHQKGRILILDEPTAAMGYKESSVIIRLIGRLKDEGLAVIVISHNLNHVFAVSDRICVMRLGALAGEFVTGSVSPEEVVQVITGADRTGDRNFRRAGDG
jgi:ABC-type sugar transport system ATPase subunit